MPGGKVILFSKNFAKVLSVRFLGFLCVPLQIFARFPVSAILAAGSAGFAGPPGN
jgi:hypothetical protein